MGTVFVLERGMLRHLLEILKTGEVFLIVSIHGAEVDGSRNLVSPSSGGALRRSACFDVLRVVVRDRVQLVVVSRLGLHPPGPQHFCELSHIGLRKVDGRLFRVPCTVGIPSCSS